MLNKLKNLAVSTWLKIAARILATQWSEEFPNKPGLYWLTYWTTSGWTDPVLIEIKFEFETMLLSSGEKFWGVNGSREMFNQAVTCLYSRTSWELRVLHSRWLPFNRPTLPIE